MKVVSFVLTLSFLTQISWAQESKFSVPKSNSAMPTNSSPNDSQARDIQSKNSASSADSHRIPASDFNPTVAEESSSADGKTGIRTKRIKHPGAKEGLYLIDEEGVYHYRVQTISKKDNSMFFRIISQTTPDISGNTAAGTFTYDDMYGGGSLTGVDFVYEWQPFKRLGKAGVQIGAGLATATGKGYFANGDARTPRESYTFISVPLSAGLVYRFEYMERQWLAPYIAGGGIYNGLIEYRNDGDSNVVGTPAAYGAAGLLINLTAMNKELAFTMDREYGFSQLWINAEYKRIQASSKDLNITSNQISVGLGADY